MSYKITRQQAIERAPLLKAWGEGAKLQYNNVGYGWTDCAEHGDILSDGSPNIQYRIKPSPTLRPWKPKEVPVGALFETGHYPVVILGVSGNCIQFAGRTSICEEHLNAIVTRKYSLDHGKTWLPCGVVDEEL